MAKHEMKAPWEREVLSYDPPTDEFYKARISTLEKENAKLRTDLEKRAEWYGMGKDVFAEKMKELENENAELVEENLKLKSALIAAEIRNVSV